MKKRFSLIEIIIVIAVLGILTVIIIPNVSNMKNKAIVSHINTNINVLQTAVDSYSLEHNGEYPTTIQPNLKNPQFINMELLYPNDLKSKPNLYKVPNQRYWVDVEGKVWGATVDAPTNVFESSTNLEWVSTSNINVKKYNVYEINTNPITSLVYKLKMSLLKTLKTTETKTRLSLPKQSSSSDYLISAEDQYGLETAPVGFGYNTEKSNFEPLLNKEGTYSFEMEDTEDMIWDDVYIEDSKPTGTAINYSYQVSDENGNYLDSSTDFYSLPKSKKIKVTIDMKGANGKYPSLYNFQIFYHYATDDKSYLKPILPISKTQNQDGTITYKTTISLNGKTLSDIDFPSSSFGGDANTTASKKSTTIKYSTDNGTTYTSANSLNQIPKNSIVEISQTVPQSVPYIQPIVYASNEDTITFSPIIVSPKNNNDNTQQNKDSSQDNNNYKDSQNNIQPELDLSKQPEIQNQIQDNSWTTIATQSFFASSGNGQKTHWISATITDKQPSNTRIIYVYTPIDGNIYYSNYTSISEVSDSRSLRVTAFLQVKKNYVGETEEPEVDDILIKHSKGNIDLNRVKPTVIIIPEKNNNKNNDIISDNSKVNWNYQAFDPTNQQILDVQWDGQKQESYAVGTYTVKCRVRNALNYWSDWTSYTFDVKQEKPTAVINSSSNYFDRQSSNELYYTNSFDSDGDTIVKGEWKIDGILSQNSNIKFDTLGQHTIELRVEDSEGNWSDWVSKKVTIIDDIPIAVISYSPSTIYNTSNIVWTYNSSTDPENNSITKGEWQLDSNSVTDNPNGVISSAGTHTMKLRVQNSEGIWSNWTSINFTVLDMSAITDMVYYQYLSSTYIGSRVTITVTTNVTHNETFTIYGEGSDGRTMILGSTTQTIFANQDNIVYVGNWKPQGYWGMYVKIVGGTGKDIKVSL